MYGVGEGAGGSAPGSTGFQPVGTPLPQTTFFNILLNEKGDRTLRPAPLLTPCPIRADYRENRMESMIPWSAARWVLNWSGCEAVMKL